MGDTISTSFQLGTKIIGLTDAAHTCGNGKIFNEAYLLNNAGEFAGDAETANGGDDAWLFDPASDQTFAEYRSVRGS